MCDACMDAVYDEKKKIEAERDALRAALKNIMNNLGVPQPNYPYPVAHAYDIAKAALGEKPE